MSNRWRADDEAAHIEDDFRTGVFRMNAYQKGRECGFAYKLTIIGGSKRHFESVGKDAASKVYARAEKQTEFLEGWMTNWKEPHPIDCICTECAAIRAIDVETY